MVSFMGYSLRFDQAVYHNDPSKYYYQDIKFITASTNIDSTLKTFSRLGPIDYLRPRWAAGGKYLHESSRQPSGLLQQVGFDLPFTIIEPYLKDGNTYMVLRFRSGDPDNPLEWSRGRKHFMASLMYLMVLFIGLANTGYGAGISSMVLDLDTSLELGRMGLFCFNFALALIPLLLTTLFDAAGRKVVYGGVYFVFVLCFLGTALGRNIATILLMRTLQGLFGGIGVIGPLTDVCPLQETAASLALFCYVAILGAVAAPVHASLVVEKLGWRWMEGIQGLSNIPLLLIILFFFQETRGHFVLKARAAQLRSYTGDQRYKSLAEFDKPGVHDLLWKPSAKSINMLLTEPVVFMFGLWIGFAWFVTFLFLSIIPVTFQQLRGWDESTARLPNLALVIGVTLGYGVHHVVQIQRFDAMMESPDKVLPEHRLYGAMFGALWLPIGLFLFSFTHYEHLPWILPTLSLVPIAFGIFFIFESTYAYTRDCYGEDSLRAIAGQTFIRNVFGSVLPLFSHQFFTEVGIQYAGLILALAACVLSLIPFVMFKYGHVLRQRSRLAVTF